MMHNFFVYDCYAPRVASQNIFLYDRLVYDVWVRDECLSLIFKVFTKFKYIWIKMVFGNDHDLTKSCEFPKRNIRDTRNPFKSLNSRMADIALYEWTDFGKYVPVPPTGFICWMRISKICSCCAFCDRRVMSREVCKEILWIHILFLHAVLN